jgi:hypothetical protein
MWLTRLFAPRPDEIRRQRRRSLSFSVMTVLLPLVVLAAGLFVLDALGINQDYVTAVTTGVLDMREWAALDPALASINDLAGRVRFAAAHTLMIMTAYAAMVAALTVSFAIFRDHGGIERAVGVFGLAVVIVTFAVAVYGAIYFRLDQLPGIKLRDFFIYLMPEILAKSQYGPAPELTRQIEVRGRYGSAIGLAAAGFLIAAASILAYRWQADVWCRPRLLRRQMLWLLSLFAFASILLVISNTAVRALLEWPVGLIPSDPGPRGASLLVSARGAAGALSYWWSVTSAALLVATFLPAFASILGDINLAALHHLGAAPSPRPREGGEPTAKEVKDWKEQNGLSLSPAEITTAILATGAPLLTAPVIDLTKAVVLPG